MAGSSTSSILAGNEALLGEHTVELPRELAKTAEAARSEGCTIIYLAIEGKAAGMIALSDTLRPDASATIEAIRTADIQTLLLTGDTAQAAGHMANGAGIADFQSNCLPEDKLAAIREYQDKGESVCMVGDGINDAPALRAAQVGIAMGGIGTDIAIEAADIALVGDNIREIPHLLKLAKKTMHTIIVNLTASMVLNFVAIGLAITGVLSPVVGALVHNVGSVVVIVNSSLLLKWRGSK